MKRAAVIFLLIVFSAVLLLAINGHGPGDGISDGPDDGAGYGSPGTGNGEGPGSGKLASIDQAAGFTAALFDVKKSKSDFISWLEKISLLIRNAFKNLFRLRNN